ncbi:MAG: aspartate--ammonia ligase [Prevotellaceae bacterium]|jgi:aspartate--ammonia ligase|nr:aspartate--ammonia ligase [Prevotellaceae bacterium]
MSNLYIPKNYKPLLDVKQTEQAIKLLKDTFQLTLSSMLKLRRVTAPLFVMRGMGLNDDLNGVERAVTFPIKDMGNAQAEIVHSLAKWKRMALAEYDVREGYGLYTDMNAIRADEEMDNTHSIYVDQWDWELHINEKQRSLKFLKEVVRKIYTALQQVEFMIYEAYPELEPVLPKDIVFMHAEELLQMYPDLSVKKRENEIAEKYGAVFLIGIGGKLSNGEKHDGRAPDYDDWSTSNEDGFPGLNGDILLWNPILKSSFEISSMGIRVDKRALLHQLKLENKEDRKELFFHKKILNDEIPLSLGGGIGQSRLCMFLLKKAHVGEVQASIWPEDMIKKCAENKIYLV